ncbi:hypothetical protein [Pseudooceanicola sp.]|uniref:hypothetical protein n=1 Tax=Pseudooceanicola sp. TaxID=1914328 RepID=UPI004058949E|tara:strand:- start:29068 stop:29256 length:189 start_codon:yes stop_codon:yes gene_type:complete
MKSFFQTYLRGEDGATTVDWVVLTAGVAAMVVFLLTMARNDTMGLAGTVTDYMSSQKIEDPL